MHFYQVNWLAMGDEVYHHVLKLLKHGSSLPGINETFITLILEVKEHTRVLEFRPINSCNVIYIIVANM